MKTTTFGGITREQHDAIAHTTAMIADGTITDADISPAAGITYNKLSLTNSIVDADIATNAGIAQSKLSLIADPGAHASRHAAGGADALPADSISKTMLNFSTWEKIAEVVPSTNVDYVDFTGLDINTDKAYVLFLTTKNPTGGSINLKGYVQGDYTDTNYYTQFLSADGTGVSAGRLNYPEFGYVRAGECNACFIVIWRDPDGYYRFILQQSYRTGSTTYVGVEAGSKTAPVTNITSLRVASPVAGGIGAGSQFVLCRVRTK